MTTTPNTVTVDGEVDPLYAEAIEAALEVRRLSVSLIQRRLMVGYTRASRIVDRMQQDGIAGEYTRSVSLSLDEDKGRRVLDAVREGEK